MVVSFIHLSTVDGTGSSGISSLTNICNYRALAADSEVIEFMLWLRVFRTLQICCY